MPQFNTLTELIIARKIETQKGIIFVLNRQSEKKVTYGELYKLSLSLLFDLQEKGFKAGDKVVFQFEKNIDFMVSFWACTLGAMVPVPLAVTKSDEEYARLARIWEILDSPKMITDTLGFEGFKSWANANGKGNVAEDIEKSYFTINGDLKEDKEGKIFYPKKEDLAFIQFSSGSTGDPKGVMITHSNVICNLTAVMDWSLLNADDVSLSWMPLTHDMGLIGDHIKNVLIGIDQVNMQTSLFITDASLWIEKVNEYHASILYSPNFGYKHFMESYDENRDYGWDLSCIKIIYNGAEPISLGETQKFINELGKYGMKKCAMAPAYGLAESTIAVSFPFPGDEVKYHTVDRRHLAIGENIVKASEGDEGAATFMDVGHAIYNCKIRITDENDEDIGENRVGFIQISGGNVTKGYYNNKKATEEAFTKDGWFNTGDLGFLHNERLTITGRAKDIIFVSGQNFYAPDIERVSDEALAGLCEKTAAIGSFSRERGCDTLVIFAVFSGTAKEFLPICAKLRRSISEKLRIEVANVVPIEALPKTTSGKIQHFKLAEDFENGEFNSVLSELSALEGEEKKADLKALPKTPTESKLLSIWQEVLGKNIGGVNENFFDVGGDSLKITRILSRINETFSVNLRQEMLYNNPDIASEAKLIDEQTTKIIAKAEAAATIKKSPLKDKFSLTLGQQSLYFIDSMSGSSTQYNLYTTLRLSGKLNAEILKKSLDAVILKNRALHTSFHEENGKPYAKVEDFFGIELKKGTAASFKEAETIAKADAAIPFDLKCAPLIKARLLEISKESHVLILVVHHIVFDGWSFSVLMKDLAFFYKAFSNGDTPETKENAIDYSDYAAFQNVELNSGLFDESLLYWKENLKNPPVLDLPTDFQRPSQFSNKGSILRTEVSGNVLSGLEFAAKKNNATLFMVLLTAFNILLSRYSGKTDIAVGTPTANRTLKETEDVIGLFTNDLVLRTTFENDSTFAQILMDVKKTTLGAFENQSVPFGKVVEALNIPREAGKNPLFQVFFALQNTPEATMDLGKVKAKRVDVDGETSRFDLSLDITEKEDKLELAFEYSTELFRKETVTAFAQEYAKLLGEAAKSFDFTAKGADILTADDKAILDKINDTKKNYDLTSDWTELFENKAKLTPDALAVKDSESSLTYRELDEKSNILANYLAYLGIGKENAVGIYLDRSVRMLIALIAVQKAGAAYLPMDPIFPRERISYMLEDARVKYIISENPIVETLPQTDAQLILLDSESERIAAFSSAPIDIKNDGKNLAYLIYTSGSTGKPKGVQIEKHSLKNLLCSMKEETKIEEGDSLLALTTLSFDIAGLELYLPLISGATVVIASRADAVDGKRLAAKIFEDNITFMQATPATWRLLLESGFSGKSDLTVLCGGEAFPKELANRLIAKSKDVINVYGPTETTIWSTFDYLKNDDEHIKIGKPLANTTVYVVDENMNRVPVGVQGELLIGGEGLSRGYRNLDKLTSQKFIENPFPKKSDPVLYKTGDLVKFTRDGKIEYISRRDNQIKIRGYRIELGEIETLVAKALNVKESVVTDKEIKPGEKAIVAYIVPKDGANVDVTTMREDLRKKLPSYMIPAAFVVLEKFPMTPNGKIDKRALPLPNTTKAVKKAAKPIVSSKDTTKVITEIWKEVLNLDEIDSESNFFDIGGHSLLLSVVRSKLEEMFNKEISIMDLFNYPTVKSLSAFISGDSEEAENAEIEEPKQSENHDIAVIGLSGRFPGAENIDEFWKNLCEGKESIGNFSDEEAIADGADPEVLSKKNHVNRWGAIEKPYHFDAGFFGYNPTEATTIDPQQRIFLEEAWKAFENAGYDTAKINSPVAVFASVGMNTYAENLRDSKRGLSGDYQIMTGNEKDFLATRTAYKLGLRGPAATVQTACSSSMTALHLACESLNKGECEMALAGGVSVRLPQKQGYLYEEGMILSPDGHCRAFDKSSKGTVGGNGCGAVVLKRLADAVRDGDYVSAVIKGTAINNDGSDKIGYTAPSVSGESKAIIAAEKAAGVDPSTISYVETHGTGTPLGDPIEIEALQKVFGAKTSNKNFCALGSVKTNIGHLDAASGIAGLIKTVLSLRNGEIPPSLNFSEPNPKIDFKNSAFYVNTKLQNWESKNTPRRAAVSSFGIGGTNVHAVLEEAPQRAPDYANIRYCLLVFSAKDKAALENSEKQFAEFLKANPETDLVDAAFTLQVGRREFKYRSFVVAKDVPDAVSGLLDATRLHKNADGALASEKTIDDPASMNIEKLGFEWLNGAKVDFRKLYNTEKMNRIPLPTYPFNRREYRAKKAQETKPEIATKSESKRNTAENCFYAPLFKELPFIDTDPTNTDVKTLVFARASGASNETLKLLRSKNIDITAVYCDNSFEKLPNEDFKIDIRDELDFEKAIELAIKDNDANLRIINLLGLTGREDLSNEKALEAGKELYLSLIYTAIALGNKKAQSKTLLKVVTDKTIKTFADSDIIPEKSLALGAVRVIPIEYKSVACELLDTDPENITDDVIGEILSETGNRETAVRFNKKFVYSYENLKLASAAKREIKLKDGGVYIVFGGLGGVGLLLSKVLCDKKGVKLILVTRSKFPDKNLFDEYLLTHDADDATSQKIKTIRKFEKGGAEVLTYSADITSRDDMNRLREEVLAKYGAVDGIIDAAGAAGGGMIQNKTSEIVDRAFSSKVKGTLTFYKAFRETNPDFIVLVSSLNAVTGGFGQSDYSAANAFLDAFANANASSKTRIISIDFDRFPGIGIAKNKKREEKEVNAILGKCVLETSEKSIFMNTFYPEKDWILSEHKVQSVPTVAGTTYLEMARAAFSFKTKHEAAKISNVVFLKPLDVDFKEKRTVFTVIEKSGDGCNFKIVSIKDGSDTFAEHAMGEISALSEKAEEKTDIESLKSKINEKTLFSSEKENEVSQKFISFGARWLSLQSFSVNETEGLAKVSLDCRFDERENGILLHPSVLDVATGTLRLASGGDYLPFSYKEIKIFTALPCNIYSRLKFNGDVKLGGEIIGADIDVFSESGELLVKITGFSMKKVSKTVVGKESTESQGSYTELRNLLESKSDFLNQGLTKAEGEEVFRNILRACSLPQIIVSMKDINEAFREADYVKNSNTAKNLASNDTREKHPRPELESAYVAPRNETETKLCALWQDILGIEKVGIYDEFFALGGDSLLLIQFHTRLKEDFKSSLAIVDLYKFNTIALVAENLSGKAEEEKKPAFTAVNSRAQRQRELMEKRRMQRIKRG